MGKQLNMICSLGNVPLADDRKKFSRMMFIENIEEHPEFKTLYRIDPEVLDRITKSMSESGYDDSQPVHIWITEDGHSYLIDGYTRYTASLKAGITSIPVYEHNFRNFDEAYRYVLKLQVNRRNLNGDELLRNVSLLSRCSFIKEAEGRKCEAIARNLGVSSKTVQRALSVEKNADDELRGQIERKEVTINQAYKKLHAVKKKTDVKEVVKKIAYYVIAEMKCGFTAENLINDEDFKSALEDPGGFELPENDIQVLVQMGINEELLRGNNGTEK